MSVVPANDLEVLLRSRVPIIVIDTRDESQVLKSLARACARLAAATPVPRTPATPGAAGVTGTLAAAGVRSGLPLFQWTVTDGLKRLDIAIGPPQRIVSEPLEVLKHMPDRNERRQLVEDVAREWMRANPRQAVRIDARALELLVENMSGLSAADTQRLARKAIFDHGAIQASDVPLVMQAKYELLNHGGVLRYEHDTAPLADVGGLASFKAWLQKRCAAFDGSAPELDAPKGVLLLGVQGCGKSLAARASAGIFSIPLLRLDCAALYDKYVGESERNLRESLAAADVLAPCVMWIDEIEKGFAAGDSDGGATRRVLGAFLTWLAEKSSRVFVVATANDITALPPELIRKGRFDEIFFVDLPNSSTRAEILRIHAAKRGIALDSATLGVLAEECESFSGAEIEQAIVAALYTAHARHAAPDAQLLSAEIAATRPLAVVMAEAVAALRAWAKERTVPAE